MSLWVTRARGAFPSSQTLFFLWEPLSVSYVYRQVRLCSASESSEMMLWDSKQMCGKHNSGGVSSKQSETLKQAREREEGWWGSALVGEALWRFISVQRTSLVGPWITDVMWGGEQKERDVVNSFFAATSECLGVPMRFYETACVCVFLRRVLFSSISSRLQTAHFWIILLHWQES